MKDELLVYLCDPFCGLVLVDNGVQKGIKKKIIDSWAARKMLSKEERREELN